MATDISQPTGLVSPKFVNFDVKNPRGETADQIQQDPDFLELRKSVRKYGVLVPLVVRPSNRKQMPFQLLDGERRLRAALAENQDLVPVHIIKGKEVDGRILAYQIHMLRKRWSKSNELVSIKEIRDELLKDNKNLDDSQLFVKLKDVTNHKPAELRDLISLLKFDEQTIAKLQRGELLLSHLVQIDMSFIAPFSREFPGMFRKYGDSNLRKILVNKAENGRLGNTRYLMDHVLKFFIKDEFKAPERRAKFKQLLKKFLDDEKREVSAVVEGMSQKQKRTRKAKKPKKAHKANAKPGETDVPKETTFEYETIDITKKEQKRIEDIRPLFEKELKELSSNETEYLKEAIYCLEKHCFKAATLMIWSAGISRILRYISNDLPDFNRVSKEMADKPKSVYRYLSKNFLQNATDLEQIRENCNDRQLLSYLVYKNFLSMPEFKKLKGNYDTRNDCAHPTEITLSPNEIVVIFENVHNLILNNKKLT
jgi:hypothetical protein